MHALRVFLVDEHEVVRRGVAAMIGDADDMEVVGQADSVRAALLRLPPTKPDVAVLGAKYATGSGVDLCRELGERAPATRVLMFTADRSDETMIGAFLAGAAGYVDKTTSGEHLVATIRVVGAGASLLDPHVATAVIERLRNPVQVQSPFADLTASEYLVLECLGQGMTNRQIAEHLHFAEKTAKNYTSRIMAKLDVTSRTQAALLYADRDGN